MNISVKSNISPKKLCRVCTKKSEALQNLTTKRNEQILIKLRSFCFIQVSLFKFKLINSPIKY